MSLTAPLNNSTIYDSLVSHTTTLTAIASDSQSGVASVQFRIDGRIIATDAAAPYSASWNTTSVADGPHTLTVIAKDRAGKTATTTGTVTVVHDYRPPTVSLTAPLNNSTIYDSLVSHTTTLTAIASDSQSGVASVQFLVDSKPLPPATPTGSNTYSTSWDTTSVADGPHTLTVIATDGAGNTTATTGTVTVAHDHTPPAVSLTAPLNHSTIYDSLVSHTTTLTANASDSQSGVASVQFLVDSKPLPPATPTGSNTYSTSWDTTSVADGPHTLTVIATDGAGNTATTTGAVTVEHDHTILIPTPGSPLVESGLFASLNVSLDEFGHGFASLQQTNAAGNTTTTLVPLATNLLNGVPQAIPGVTGPGTNNPLTLAYHLPTAVIPGDAVILNFQTGQLSDVLRFTDTIDFAHNTIQGWVLVYSDFTATNPADSPADTFNGDTLAGLPADFNPFSPLDGVTYEFGVEGFNVAEYTSTQTVGVGPEQASYSFLSDGNLIPTTGG